MWSQNNSMYMHITIFPHKVEISNNEECWCDNNAADHYKHMPILDISSVNYNRRLFEAINLVWNSQPREFLVKSRSDHVLIITASVSTICIRNGKTTSVQRSVSVLPTKNNIASCTHHIYTYLSGKLAALEEQYKNNIKPITALHLIASFDKVAVSNDIRSIKKFCWESTKDTHPTIAYEANVIPRVSATKRKSSSSPILENISPSSYFFVPRDFEMCKGINENSHPLLQMHNSTAKPSSKKQMKSKKSISASIAPTTGISSPGKKETSALELLGSNQPSVLTPSTTSTEESSAISTVEIKKAFGNDGISSSISTSSSAASASSSASSSQSS